MRSLLVLKKSQALVASLFLSLTFLLTSCGGVSSNLQIPGVDGPHVTLINDDVLITMRFENLVLDGGARYAIPKYPNSYIEISPALEGGVLMAASINIKDAFGEEVKLLPPQRLPDGRPLPGVINGQLPAVAFSIEKFLGITVYAGPEVFGIFVPADIPMEGAIISGRLKVKGKDFGTASLITKNQDGEGSGVLVLFNLKSLPAKYAIRKAL